MLTNPLLVKQAFFLKTVHIVSFDWLEDSLMKGRPRDERDYLIAPRVKVEAATKAKKKKARRENIKKGSKFNIKCIHFLNVVCFTKSGEQSLTVERDA